MVALVDCNNFYASCERVFRPELQGKPIVVLSNNDGCVVARSEEAKQVGIGMAVPIFKVKDLIHKYQVNVFSSNYTLYGDLSSRVMNVLAESAPRLEVYSIDEAFLDLEGLAGHNLSNWGIQLRQKVKQWTGIPVSVGIAPTKTLAKVANHLAKSLAKKGEGSGVKVLSEKSEQKEVLENLSVADIWGIGYQLSQKLQNQGVWTAAQLLNMPDAWIRKQLSVTGLRTVEELRGIPRLEISEVADPKKMAICSLSFDKTTADYAIVKEYVANFAARCAEKLREQNSVASNLTVYLRTNRFNPQAPQMGASETLHFAMPTAYTPEIIKVALQGLGRIYQPGFEYKKASITLTGLLPAALAQTQTDLFANSPSEITAKQMKMMEALDSLNQKMGRNKIKFASQGNDDKWQTYQAHRSPRYTTQWDELLRVVK
jgi:DNA polymerase V